MPVRAPCLVLDRTGLCTGGPRRLQSCRSCPHTPAFGLTGGSRGYLIVNFVTRKRSLSATRHIERQGTSYGGVLRSLKSDPGWTSSSRSNGIRGTDMDPALKRRTGRGSPEHSRFGQWSGGRNWGLRRRRCWMWRGGWPPATWCAAQMRSRGGYGWKRWRS